MTDSTEDDEVQAVQYEMDPVVIDSNGRTVAWLDDMVAAAQSSLQGVPGDAVQWCAVRLAFRDGLVFALIGRFSGADDEWGWGIVRTSLRSRLAILHGNSRVLDDPTKQFSESAALTFVKPEPSWKQSIKKIMCNDELMQVLKSHLEGNDLLMPLVLQPYYTSHVLPSVWQSAKSLTDRLLDFFVC